MYKYVCKLEMYDSKSKETLEITIHTNTYYQRKSRIQLNM